MSEKQSWRSPVEPLEAAAVDPPVSVQQYQPQPQSQFQPQLQPQLQPQFLNMSGMPGMSGMYGWLQNDRRSPSSYPVSTGCGYLPSKVSKLFFFLSFLPFVWSFFPWFILVYG